MQLSEFFSAIIRKLIILNYLFIILRLWSGRMLFSFAGTRLKTPGLKNVGRCCQLITNTTDKAYLYEISVGSWPS